MHVVYISKEFTAASEGVSEAAEFAKAALLAAHKPRHLLHHLVHLFKLLDEAVHICNVIT